MWLTLEKGIARALRRRHGPDLDSRPEQDGRRALVLQAAQTLLPEAGVDSLPGLARDEVAAGLTGPIRRAIAATDPTQSAVAELRDHLVERLSGRLDGTGAVLVADRVHLTRLVRGDVPAIVAIGCVGWYGAYRSSADPTASLVASLLRLSEAWMQRPADRAPLERAMVDQAASLVGDQPDDLLDATV